MMIVSADDATRTRAPGRVTSPLSYNIMYHTIGLNQLAEVAIARRRRKCFESPSPPNTFLLRNEFRIPQITARDEDL